MMHDLVKLMFFRIKWFKKYFGHVKQKDKVNWSVNTLTYSAEKIYTSLSSIIQNKIIDFTEF